MQSHRASGAFTVSMHHQADTGFARPSADAAGSVRARTPGTVFGRVLLEKQYQGDLQARAHGQMLSAITPTGGSAGYVAIEQVSGTLHGRQGSFVLQHSGLMDRGTPQLEITVVPDSGTGALAGLTGRLQVRISEGQHSYDF